MPTKKPGTAGLKRQGWEAGSWRMQPQWPSPWTSSESRRLPGRLWLAPHTQRYLLTGSRGFRSFIIPPVDDRHGNIITFLPGLSYDVSSWFAHHLGDVQWTVSLFGYGDGAEHCFRLDLHHNIIKCCCFFFIVSVKWFITLVSKIWWF